MGVKAEMDGRRRRMEKIFMVKGNDGMYVCTCISSG
jgi:hypothetical protein